MAIDTRNKRASAIGIDSIRPHVYPNPDGSLNQADRQQIAYKYSGILASSGSGVVTKYRTLMGMGR